MDPTSHLEACAFSLLILVLVFGPYDILEFHADFSGEVRIKGSLGGLLIVRYAMATPACAAAAAFVFLMVSRTAWTRLGRGSRAPTPRGDLGPSSATVIEGSLILLSSLIGTSLIVCAPEPRPMWASCILCVHVFYVYTMLAIEPVLQALLAIVISAAGAAIVYAFHIADSSSDEQFIDQESRVRWVLSLVLWLLIFHIAGIAFASRRRRELAAHIEHRCLSVLCGEAIVEDVEACKQLLKNIFPPQVLTELLDRDTLHVRTGELRGIVVAQQYANCSFLFAKVVGLSELVSDESQEPKDLVQLLQSIFDRFDTLTETYNVQKVRKTVNESYMVAAGLPDTQLLRTPEQRALGIAALAFAMLHVMDVVNAERHGLPPLDIQIGIHSGSAIAGVIGHRRIQYDLVGDAVNTAARMCTYSKPGRVLVSQMTYELLGWRYEVSSCEPRVIKGKGSMNTYFLERRIPSSLLLRDASPCPTTVYEAKPPSALALHAASLEPPAQAENDFSPTTDALPPSQSAAAGSSQSLLADPEFSGHLEGVEAGKVTQPSAAGCVNTGPPAPLQLRSSMEFQPASAAHTSSMTPSRDQRVPPRTSPSSQDTPTMCSRRTSTGSSMLGLLVNMRESAPVPPPTCLSV